MRLHELRPPEGARRPRKRLGRGTGSGRGKTSGRGMKGQKSREQVRPGFEGGQTPLTRRMRKRRGISKSAHPRRDRKPEYAIVNVGQLSGFPAGTEIGPKDLIQAGLAKRIRDGIRVLGDGDLDRPLQVMAHHFSSSARQKIEAAGGTVTLLPSG